MRFAKALALIGMAAGAGQAVAEVPEGDRERRYSRSLDELRFDMAHWQSSTPNRLSQKKRRLRARRVGK